MVYCSSSLVDGCSLASWRVLTVCSRMDCILGPHWSHRPLATRTTESAVRSRSAKMRVSSRLTPGAPRSSARSMRRTRVARGSGTCSRRRAHQVGVGIDDDDGVAVPARRLLPELVGDDVVHQGALAHAGAGDVEVVAAQQVAGEADGTGLARGGVADARAALDACGATGVSAREPDRSTRGVSSPCSGRMPEGGHLADAQDAAPAEEARGRRDAAGAGRGAGRSLLTLNLAPAGLS